MSDTPRTNEMVFEVPRSKSFDSPVTVQLSWATFARQLERELTTEYQRGLNDGLEQAARICEERISDESCWPIVLNGGPNVSQIMEPEDAESKACAEAIRAQIKK